MIAYSVTLAAQSDIEEIVASIWQENSLVAEQIEECLFQGFALLAENPRLGHRRQDLTDRPVLFWPVRHTPYAAIYKADSPIVIVRVIHWHRDIASLLLNEGPSS